MRNRRFEFFRAVACAALFGGCASTSLVGFVDPDYQAARFRSVAVYVNTSDLMWRQALEKSTVGTFTKVGVRAVSRIEILPPTREFSPEARRRILKEHGAGAPVMIEVDGAGVEQAWIPVLEATTVSTGSITSTGIGETRSTTTYDGGYSVSKPWASMQTRVLDIESGRTAWISSSFSGGSAYSSFEDVRRSYSMELVRELGRKEIVLTTRPLSALDSIDRRTGRLT